MKWGSLSLWLSLSLPPSLNGGAAAREKRERERRRRRRRGKPTLIAGGSPSALILCVYVCVVCECIIVVARKSFLLVCEGGPASRIRRQLQKKMKSFAK